MSEVSRREAKKALHRRRILETAQEVFFRDGFVEANLDEIAKGAGVAKGTYLFALPGSTGACKDAWDNILKDQLDIRHKPCNFAELLPRLREHEVDAAE